jgi:hypothetical protein
MTAYTPTPIDTADVKLPASLQPLMEQLAANTHDVWAAQRISEGWTYGPHRDDKQKKHPCLVAYDQLPETEKEYDRKTAEATLKAIMKLGFTIQ